MFKVNNKDTRTMLMAGVVSLTQCLSLRFRLFQPEGHRGPRNEVGPHKNWVLLGSVIKFRLF